MQMYLNQYDEILIPAYYDTPYLKLQKQAVPPMISPILLYRYRGRGSLTIELLHVQYCSFSLGNAADFTSMMYEPMASVITV